jgi:hypothetical protein
MLTRPAGVQQVKWLARTWTDYDDTILLIPAADAFVLRWTLILGVIFEIPVTRVVLIVLTIVNISRKGKNGNR